MEASPAFQSDEPVNSDFEVYSLASCAFLAEWR